MALPGISRRDLLLAASLALSAAAFRLPELGQPREEYFDEVYHAKTALQILRKEPPVEWVHPPTAKLLIAGGVWAFGYEAWAWRLAPALAGIALAPVFFLFARRVLATERAALIASVLLLCDGVYLVQSRIAMTNIFAVLFQMTAALLLLRAVLSDRLGLLPMLAFGTALGLALSTRWTSLWAAAFLGLVTLAVRGRRILRPRELATAGLAFVAMPIALYFLSYAPLDVLASWMKPGQTSLKDVLDLQKMIWSYHANLQAQHPYFSAWYTWPWLYRPTWYYFQYEGESVRGIIALGNPALWWVSVPVTLWALVTGIRARDPRRVLAGVGFCALYLPWGISPRTLNYSHYLFEAIPYSCLALGALLDREWDGPLAPLARAYVGLVLLLFLVFLPLFMGLLVPKALFNRTLFDGVRLWTWFPTWI